MLSLCYIGTAYAAGTVLETTFYSPALAKECSVQVYLPDGYDPMGGTEYPTIYFLHGALDNHMGYPYLLGVFDMLIENQIIEPVIVIKPDARSYPFLVSWYTNSLYNGFFEDYIVNDLIDFTETNYCVVPDRGSRYVMGHSAGGYGSMTLGLKHPDLYSRLAAHSGALELNVMMVVALPALLSEYTGPPYIWNPMAGFFSGVFFSLGAAFSPNFTNPPFYVDLPLDENAVIIQPIWQLWLQHNPPLFAAGLPQNADLAIYFDCGTMDEMGCYPQNLVFADALAQLGIDHVFQSYVGDHFTQLPERFSISIVFLVGLKAAIEFQPTTLNLKSNGNWVTCHIQLPGDYSAADIDPSTVVLNKINGVTLDPPIPREGPYAIGNHGGRPCLMVKFSREALIDELYTMGICGEGVELGVAGELTSRIPFHDCGLMDVIGTGGPQGSEMAGKNGYFLYQSTPNPFKTTTAIKYEVPKATRVKISVYNAIGQRVATLVDAQQEAGTYSITWEAKNLANGVYICRMEAGGNTKNQKMLLLK
jgi:enterochelin esterase-like enzyme